MATVGFCTFETGDASELLALSGTASVQSSVARTGTYALRCNPTTVGTGYGRLQALDATGVQAAASVSTSYVRFYFKYLVLPGANENIVTVQTNKLAIQINASGVLVASRPGTGTISTGTTALASGVWYRIEVKCGTNATSAAWELLIDGASELSGAATWMTSNTVEIGFGKTVNNNGKTVDFYYDDILWSDSAYPGAGQGAMALPTADGTFTDGTPNGALNLWKCVDQVPSDGDSTYIDALSINQIYTARFGSIAGNQINSVKPLIITRNLGAGGSHSLRFRSGSNTDTTAVAAGSSYAPYARIFDTNPANSALWTAGALGGVEAGIVQTVAGNRLTGVFLLADIATGDPAAGGIAGVANRARRHGLRYWRGL